MRTLVKFALATFLISCHVVDKSNITKIEVFYIPGIAQSPFVNNCDSAVDKWHFNDKYVDTVISDSIILGKISHEIKKLRQIDTTFPVDGRIKCDISYSDGSIDQLCMGSLIGTNYNQRQVIDNLLLNFLLKKYSGYYYFIPFELVLKMPEIASDSGRILEIRRAEKYYKKLGEPDLLNEDSLIEIKDVRELPYLEHDSN